MERPIPINVLTSLIIEACINIHIAVGPCCFEKIYEELLYYELTELGLNVERQVLLPVKYKKLFRKNAYKIDLLVEGIVVVEIKSVFPLPSVYFKQVRSQLSLTNLKHGMLINFKENLIKDGIHRVFNNKGRESMD